MRLNILHKLYFFENFTLYRSLQNVDLQVVNLVLTMSVLSFSMCRIMHGIKKVTQIFLEYNFYLMKLIQNDMNTLYEWFTEGLATAECWQTSIFSNNTT